MTDVVTPHARVHTALQQLAQTDELLVALDFDGTVSPLADEPMSARALPAAAEAIARLVRLPRTTVAFVSGRSLRDLMVISEHTADSRVHLAGSHGAEFWHPGDPETSEVDPTADALRAEVTRAAEAVVADIDGAWIEHKSLGLGLHTRLCSDGDAEKAQRLVDTLIAERAPGWRRRVGHDILEFAASDAGKDAAVAALRSALGASAVLFAGDDVTDEDALRSLAPGDLGVRIGSGDSVAPVRVPDVAGFARTLDLLADLRAAELAGTRE